MTNIHTRGWKFAGHPSSSQIKLQPHECPLKRGQEKLRQLKFDERSLRKAQSGLIDGLVCEEFIS